MTTAPVGHGRAQSRRTEPGFALYVGLGEAGVAGRALLADLAQAVVGLVSDLAPQATTRSALALGGRGSQGEVVARLREALEESIALADDGSPAAGSASTRARTAWQTQQPAEVVLDTDARTLTVDGRDVTLTFKEFALLEYLLRSAHRAVSREELLETVWRNGVSGAGTRTIDVHVRRLREKLGGCLQIVTVRGVGYRCDSTPENVLVGSGDAG